jgi:sugar phosphate permease
MGADPVMRAMLPVGRTWLAIAAGYLGLFAMACIPAPIALIVGILAILDLKKRPEMHGMGRAVFGVVMGAIGTLAIIVMIVSGLVSRHH